jgi:Flp pilus assembly protein CpaB
VIRLVRDHALALLALALALVGLVAGSGSTAAAQIGVVVVTRTLPADAVVGPHTIRIVRIDARDRTPGMATKADEVLGRVARVRLSVGDYVLRASVAGRPASVALRAGERAVPLSIDAAAAPPLALLREGVHVDVVAEHDADRDGPARSQLVARDMVLLGGTRSTDEGLVVTIRAPLRVALALATAQAQAHRLRLFVRSSDGQAGSG